MKTICEQCKYSNCDALKEPCKSGVEEMKIYNKCSSYKPTFKARVENLIRKDK